MADVQPERIATYCCTQYVFWLVTDTMTPEPRQTFREKGILRIES